MADALIVVTIAVFMIIGYFVMKRIDAFLSENLKSVEGEERGAQDLSFSDPDDYEAMVKEIEAFRKTHGNIVIVVRERSGRGDELTENRGGGKTAGGD